MTNAIENIKSKAQNFLEIMQQRAAEKRAKEVEQNFQSLFGRSPEAEGLKYYVESGLSGDALTNAIREGAEANPNPNANDVAAVTANRDEITNLYRQLFDREPAQEGLEYWANSGLTGNDLIAAMLKGAQGEDIPGGGEEGFDLDGYTQAMQEWIGKTGVFGDNQGTSGLLSDGPGEYEQSPGYDFRLAEGEKAVQRGAAARGDLLGGATQKALTRFGQDYATNDYDNFLSRYYDSLNPWLSLAGAGQVSANNSSTAANQFGSSVAGNLTNTGTNIGNTTTSGNNLVNANTIAAGNAQAAGGINAANAYGQIAPNAINAYATWKYFQ